MKKAARYYEYRAALENKMKTQSQFISSKSAAQAAAVLQYPAPARQHREARRILRAWQQQNQFQQRAVAR